MKKTYIDRYNFGMSRDVTSTLFNFRRFVESCFKLKIIIEDQETSFQARVYKGKECITTFTGTTFLYLNSCLIGFHSGYKACLQQHYHPYPVGETQL